MRKCTCEGGNRVTNGLPAKLCAGRNVIHVSFLREKGDKLLGIHSWPLCGSVEFSDDFFITKTHLGGPRQCLRVDILPDVRQFAISNGNGEDPMVLERPLRGFDSSRSEADDQNPVSQRNEFKGLWV